MTLISENIRLLRQILTEVTQEIKKMQYIKLQHIKYTWYYIFFKIS